VLKYKYKNAKRVLSKKKYWVGLQIDERSGAKLKGMVVLS
jgi:hypothetical protein